MWKAFHQLLEDPRQMRRPGSEQAKLSEAAHEADFSTFWRRVADAIKALYRPRKTPTLGN